MTNTDLAWPLLIEALQEPQQSLWQSAVQTFARLGKRAAPLLPKLREAELTAAATAREPLRQAIAVIERAPEIGDVAEQEQARRRVYADIAKHCRSIR